jgi:hypothetical protein
MNSVFGSAHAYHEAASFLNKHLTHAWLSPLIKRAQRGKNIKLEELSGSLYSDHDRFDSQFQDFE